jgi:hypothetical protein
MWMQNASMLLPCLLKCMCGVMSAYSKVLPHMHAQPTGIALPYLLLAADARVPHWL